MGAARPPRRRRPGRAAGGGRRAGCSSTCAASTWRAPGGHLSELEARGSEGRRRRPLPRPPGRRARAGAARGRGAVRGGAATTPRACRRRARVGRRPAGRDAGVRRAAAGGTGRCTSRCGTGRWWTPTAPAGWPPGPSRCPAAGTVLANLPAPPAAPRSRHGAPAWWSARSRAPRLVAQLADRLGAELVPLGSAGAKVMAVVRGRGRRLRPRRRAVRVGQRRARRRRRGGRPALLPPWTARRCATTSPTRGARSWWSAGRTWPTRCSPRWRTCPRPRG